MGFQFPLAAVLRMRGIIEEREEGVLQKILLDIAKICDDVGRIDVQVGELESLRHAQALEPCLALQLRASYGEIKQLKERRKDCEAQLQKLEKAREQQMVVYSSARRDRELLSDLHEQKRTAYEAEVAKREQSVLDDNYIARRGRL